MYALVIERKRDRFRQVVGLSIYFDDIYKYMKNLSKKFTPECRGGSFKETSHMKWTNGKVVISIRKDEEVDRDMPGWEPHQWYAHKL